ncbi:hypothetical protein Q427_09245 [Halomonas sp. BC04]|nr:hypothetical protein Q427_09245 [Halomonas sp. BC04]
MGKVINPFQKHFFNIKLPSCTQHKNAATSDMSKPSLSATVMIKVIVAIDNSIDIN